jgi:hypothetical protein
MLSSCASETKDDETDYTPDNYIYEPQPPKHTIVWYTIEWYANRISVHMEYFNRLLALRGANFEVEFRAIPGSLRNLGQERRSLGNIPQAIKTLVDDGAQVDIFFTGRELSNRYGRFDDRRFEAIIDGEYQFGMWQAKLTEGLIESYQLGLMQPWDEYLINTEAGQKLFELMDDRYWRSVSVNGSIYGLNPHKYHSLSFGLMIDDPEIPLHSEGVNVDFIRDYFWESPAVVMYELDKTVGFRSMLGFDLIDIFTLMNVMGYSMITESVAFEANRGAFNFWEDELFIRRLNTLREYDDFAYISTNPARRSKMRFRTVAEPFVVSGYDFITLA